MRRQYKTRDRRERRQVTIKKADAEPIQIKGSHRDEKGNDKERGCRGSTKGNRTIKRADAEAMQITVPQKELCDNKESRCRGYTNQGSPDGGDGRQ